MNAEMFHNAVVRHRRFAHRMHRHMGTLGRVTADRFFHRAASGHMTNRHRFIFTGDLAQLQRLHQPGLRRNGFRHHHQTGGVFIQTVNDTRARHIGNRRIVVQQRIQHSTVRVARARMNNQIARFVDHEDVIIFVNDIERNILRLEARLFFDFTSIAMRSPPALFLSVCRQWCHLPIRVGRGSILLCANANNQGTIRPKPDLSVDRVDFRSPLR
jgi:hypothetical protein